VGSRRPLEGAGINTDDQASTTNSKNSTNIIDTHGMAGSPGSHIVILVFLMWHYVNGALVPVNDAMVIPPLVEYLKRNAENLNGKGAAAL